MKRAIPVRLQSHFLWIRVLCSPGHIHTLQLNTMWWACAQTSPGIFTQWWCCWPRRRKTGRGRERIQFTVFSNIVRVYTIPYPYKGRPIYLNYMWRAKGLVTNFSFHLSEKKKWPSLKIQHKLVCWWRWKYNGEQIIHFRMYTPRIDTSVSLEFQLLLQNANTQAAPSSPNTNWSQLIRQHGIALLEKTLYMQYSR